MANYEKQVESAAQEEASMLTNALHWAERISTKPELRASNTMPNTIGTVVVCCKTATVAGVVVTSTKSGCKSPNSFALPPDGRHATQWRRCALEARRTCRRYWIDERDNVRWMVRGVAAPVWVHCAEAMRVYVLLAFYGA